MLHAHKNRPHMSGLRNKDKKFFIIKDILSHSNTWDRWDIWDTIFFDNTLVQLIPLSGMKFLQISDKKRKIKKIIVSNSKS